MVRLRDGLMGWIARPSRTLQRPGLQPNAQPRVLSSERTRGCSNDVRYTKYRSRRRGARRLVNESFFSSPQLTRDPLGGSPMIRVPVCVRPLVLSLLVAFPASAQQQASGPSLGIAQLDDSVV